MRNNKKEGFYSVANGKDIFFGKGVVVDVEKFNEVFQNHARVIIDNNLKSVNFIFDNKEFAISYRDNIFYVNDVTGFFL